MNLSADIRQRLAQMAWAMARPSVERRVVVEQRASYRDGAAFVVVQYREEAVPCE